MDKRHQKRNLFFGRISKNNNQHDLARRRSTDNEVSQSSFMCSKIIKRYVLRYRKVTYSIPDRVGRILLQRTMIYIQDLIKPSRHVKAKRMHIRRRDVLVHRRQPSLVRKSEF